MSSPDSRSQSGKTAVAVLHIVAGATTDVHLELDLPLCNEYRSTMEGADFLFPPLLPQLQSRLGSLTGDFFRLVWFPGNRMFRSKLKSGARLEPGWD